MVVVRFRSWLGLLDRSLVRLGAVFRPASWDQARCTYVSKSGLYVRLLPGWALRRFSYASILHPFAFILCTTAPILFPFAANVLPTAAIVNSLAAFLFPVVVFLCTMLAIVYRIAVIVLATAAVVLSLAPFLFTFVAVVHRMSAIVLPTTAIVFRMANIVLPIAPILLPMGAIVYPMAIIVLPIAAIVYRNNPILYTMITKGFSFSAGERLMPAPQRSLPGGNGSSRHAIGYGRKPAPVLKSSKSAMILDRAAFIAAEAERTASGKTKGDDDHSGNGRFDPVAESR